MNKKLLFLFTFFLLTSCMNERQEEEAAPHDANPQRYRGGNDREGMGDITE